MEEPLSSAAILVFIRNEWEEVRQKTFSNSVGRRGNLQIVKALNRHVISAARKTGLPAFVIRGERQRGNNFGNRFANAIEEVFAIGFEQVIAIGNDCPEISSESLTSVAERLTRNDLVVGPNTIGGIYILGISRRVYDRAKFLELPWQTAGLYQSFLDYAAQLDCQPHLLGVSRDINDSVAFRAALSTIRKDSLLFRYLQSILSFSLVKVHFLNQAYYICPVYPQLTLRAPPVPGC